MQISTQSSHFICPVQTQGQVPNVYSPSGGTTGFTGAFWAVEEAWQASSTGSSRTSRQSTRRPTMSAITLVSPAQPSRSTTLMLPTRQQKGSPRNRTFPSTSQRSGSLDPNSERRRLSTCKTQTASGSSLSSSPIQSPPSILMGRDQYFGSGFSPSMCHNFERLVMRLRSDGSYWNSGYCSMQLYGTGSQDMEQVTIENIWIKREPVSRNGEKFSRAKCQMLA